MVQSPKRLMASFSFGPAEPPSATVRPRTRPVRVSGSNAQPGPAGADGLQHLWRAVAILDIGAVHGQSDPQPEPVRDEVTLAALDLLAGAANPSPVAKRDAGRA